MVPRARGGTRARLALACVLIAGLLLSQAQGANVTTMCKVHTHFNATASIVGSFGNGTCAMYLHGWDPGGTGNNGWDTVDCAQAIPAALQAYGAVCCGDSPKALCAPKTNIYPNCERSLGNYPTCDRQLSFEEMLAGLSQPSQLRMPDWMEAGCPCHQALWGGYAGKKPTELVQTLQCLYDEAKRGCKVCDAGHTGSGGGACTACAAGKYKPVPGDTECRECPTGTASPLRSISLEACTCRPGYGDRQAATGACSACEAGFFKVLQENGPCVACELGQISGKSLAS